MRFPRSHSQLWALPGAAAVLLAQPACTTDTCAVDVDKIQVCGRIATGDTCRTPLDRCQTACWSRASCGEWRDIDEQRIPADITRCLQKCSARFRCADGASIDARWECDGAQDCVDGSDEGDSKCQYFYCNNGQAVGAYAECDNYAECSDGSDEDACR